MYQGNGALDTVFEEMFSVCKSLLYCLCMLIQDEVKFLEETIKRTRE